MTAYGRDFNKTEWVSCLIKKYNEIWKNVSNIIKKEFDSNPVYNGKYTKTKKKYLIMEKSTQIFTIIKN